MRETVFLGILLVFIFQNPLESRISLLQYYDEGYALLILPVLGYNVWKHHLRISKRVWILLGLLASFLIIGWAGHCIHQYQPLTNALKDMYVNMKFFMALGVSYLLFKEMDTRKLTKALWYLMLAVTVVLSLITLIDIFTGAFAREYRFGLPSVRGIYSAYTYLVAQCALLLAIGFYLYEVKQKSIIIPICLLSFIIFFTMRTKALGALAAAGIIYVLLFGKSKKLSILAWGVIGIAVFAALSQVRHYYLNLGSDSARGVLTIASAYVAVDHFPFGTGWGTFGSAFSVEPYSPVYAMYNMHNVWGISESFPDFISDTFWPMILAQCGFIGFIVYIAVLLLVFKWILELRQKSSYVLASGLMIFAYLLIVTTGESAFVNPTAVPLAMWIGYLLGNSNAKSINNI